MNKKKTGCAVPVIIILLICIAYWWRTTRIHVYKSTTSPDQSWAVTLLRKHTAPPPMEGVDVMVRVKNSRDTTIFDGAIDNRDLWTDVEARYPDHRWESNDALRLGKASTFADDYTGQLIFKNETAEPIPFVSARAGRHTILLMNLKPQEERTVGFPLNTWLEWIAIRYQSGGSRIRKRVNYTTRCADDFKSTFVISLNKSDVSIENADFKTYKTNSSRSSHAIIASDDSE